MQQFTILAKVISAKNNNNNVKKVAGFGEIFSHKIYVPCFFEISPYLKNPTTLEMSPHISANSSQ